MTSLAISNKNLILYFITQICLIVQLHFQHVAFCWITKTTSEDKEMRCFG